MCTSWVNQPLSGTVPWTTVPHFPLHVTTPLLAYTHIIPLSIVLEHICSLYRHHPVIALTTSTENIFWHFPAAIWLLWGITCMLCSCLLAHTCYCTMLMYTSCNHIKDPTQLILPCLTTEWSPHISQTNLTLVCHCTLRVQTLCVWFD